MVDVKCSSENIDYVSCTSTPHQVTPEIELNVCNKNIELHKNGQFDYAIKHVPPSTHRRRVIIIMARIMAHLPYPSTILNAYAVHRYNQLPIEQSQHSKKHQQQSRISSQLFIIILHTLIFMPNVTRIFT